MLAKRSVKPEYGTEQPANTKDQQQAADHQEASVERPRWLTGQQVGFLLLQFLKKHRIKSLTEANFTIIHWLILH